MSIDRIGPKGFAMRYPAMPAEQAAQDHPIAFLALGGSATYYSARFQGMNGVVAVDALDDGDGNVHLFHFGGGKVQYAIRGADTIPEAVQAMITHLSNTSDSEGFSK